MPLLRRTIIADLSRCAIFFLLALIPLSTAEVLPLYPITPHQHTSETNHRGLPKTVHLFSSTSSRPVSVDLLGGITSVGEYYTRIKIGGQSVRVQVDTGSSTLAFPVAECDKCLPSDQRYNPRLSKTGKARWVSCTNELCAVDTCSLHQCSKCSAHDACCADENPEACGFKLMYGDGSGARGGLMVDEMAWGNVSAPVVFGGILHDSSDFERRQVDGILGMAYEALACNPTCVEPPFQQLVKAKVVADSFGICITGSGGKLILGEFDKSLVVGEMNYVPLALSDPPTFYTMNMSNAITVGSRTISVPNLSAGILDSGTTLVVVSVTFFRMLLAHLTQFYCEVPGLCNTDRPWFMPSACVKIDDETLSKLPTITFSLGTPTAFSLELRPQDYMLVLNKPGHTDYRCVGIMAMKQMQPGTDIIFGNTVMQRFVTHYDRAHKRLGFGEAKPGCGDLPRCSSYTQCGECASQPRCSFNLRNGNCNDKHQGIGLIPYPECTGSHCLCGLGPQTSLAFGALAGLIGCLLVAGLGALVLMLYSRRRGESVPSFEDEEGAEDADGEVQNEKRYMRVPTETD